MLLLKSWSDVTWPFLLCSWVTLVQSLEKIGYYVSSYPIRTTSTHCQISYQMHPTCDCWYYMRNQTVVKHDPSCIFSADIDCTIRHCFLECNIHSLSLIVHFTIRYSFVAWIKYIDIETTNYTTFSTTQHPSSIVYLQKAWFRLQTSTSLHIFVHFGMSLYIYIFDEKGFCLMDVIYVVITAILRNEYNIPYTTVV